jgi:hypothetical protein
MKHKLIIHAVFWLSIQLVFAGCVSKGVEIGDVMVHMTGVRQAIQESAPSIRKQSQNGRELTTEYFTPNQMDEPAENKRERAYALITILGERRPYKVDVKVFREIREKNDGVVSYRNTGMDFHLAEKLAKTIRAAIAVRPEDRSFIDDFKPF